MSTDTVAGSNSADVPAATDAPHAKPRARGWIHLVSAIVAVIAGAALISVTWPLAGLEAGLATFVYTISVVGMFAVSATYHRITWKTVAARMRMKRLDHAMIFVFIAGTYTPFALLAMDHGRQERLVMSIVWGGALAGVLLKVCWPTAPKWVGVPLYLLLGWVSAFFIATIMHNAGVAAMVLLTVGGALYSIGAIMYALKWPDPWPETFGYHEFFHACTAVAAICQYIAIWFAALY
ncbi:hemolysin III family protein [Mycobacterium sp. M1]|uniref:Hemolysin III family protein n=1 Tax=Mycolicibacter acidiphilus TaxID=2835306 RepID=A0ABS5RMF9_9MYCO|nr:hemolysin III family protein [Mycolicibacter acidiphilus]MBS9534666.1 hemolysin III family protein [Mycolicibacter acidiphilus]